MPGPVRLRRRQRRRGTFHFHFLTTILKGFVTDHLKWQVSFREGEILVVLVEKTEDENWMEGYVENDPKVVILISTHCKDRLRRIE